VSIVEVSQRAGVSVVLLNRPDRLNSFDADMTTALMAAVSEADNDPDTKAIRRWPGLLGRRGYPVVR